jgi:hypothetical protein
MGAPNPEQLQQMLAKAKPVEFETIGGKDPEVRLLVTDEGKEVILRIKVTIASVLRVGNDPNSGLPNYNVQTQIAVGLLKSDPSLRSSGVFKGHKDNPAGFG